MKTNIILTGMSGAGKSTLGVLLAKALGMDFTDTDILIQNRSGKKLQQIIDSEGVESFLSLEESVVLGLRAENTVVATGGSAVYSEKAMTAQKQNGVVVYLYLPYGEIEKRLCNIKTRGIVMRRGETLQDLYRERLPLYEKYADITVDCSKNDIETNVEKIISEIEKREAASFAQGRIGR